MAAKSEKSLRILLDAQTDLKRRWDELHALGEVELAAHVHDAGADLQRAIAKAIVIQPQALEEVLS